MLQVVIGALLFLVVAVVALPYWRNRRISGVPGAYYLEQKLESLIVELWRDYKAESAEQGHRHGRQPDRLAVMAREFVPVFRAAIADGYDAEMTVFIDDFLARHEESDLARAIALVVIRHESAGDPLLYRQALLSLLQA